MGVFAFVLPRLFMSPASRSQSRDYGDDQEEARVGVNRSGTGMNLNWKAACAIGAAIVAATMWCTNVSNTSAAHTAALAELKLDIHNINSKVNALLHEKGLNPAQVVSEANAVEAGAPGRAN